MATEFSSGETTIGALVSLRADIARMRPDGDAFTADDGLSAEAGEVMTMLDDVIANLSRRAVGKRAVQVEQAEFSVINTAILVSKALAFFQLREPMDPVLQRLH